MLSAELLDFCGQTEFRILGLPQLSHNAMEVGRESVLRESYMVLAIPSQAWTLTLCSDPPELSLDLGRRTSAGPANSRRYTDETEAASFASLSV